MGSYQLIGNELHYTGDGWTTIKLTKKEVKLYEQGQLNGYDLFNDGRKVY